MQDMDLAFEASRLASNLADAFPDMPWGEPTHGRPRRRRADAAVGDRRRAWSACTTTRTWTERSAATTRARPSTTSTRRRCGGSSASRPCSDLRRLKEVERALEEGGAREPQERPPGGHAARRAQAGRARAGPGVRGAEARPRGHARGARRRRAWPSRPAPPGRGGSATPARSRCSARCSTPSSAPSRGQPIRLHARRLRAGRGRAAHRGGHGAPAGPVVQHAAARALRPREEDGARAARADRGPVPARHALPDRVQRLRAADAAGGPHRARVRARLRHEHAARVPAGGPLARAASARRAAGDHGDGRRAHGAPGRRSSVLLVAARCRGRST